MGMNFLDRAIGYIDPKAGADRALARARMNYFAYDAAQPGNRRGRSGGLFKNASSETPKAAKDRVAIMWDARDVVRNFAILRGIVGRVVQYVADRVQYVSQTGDEGVDTLYQDFFHDWCKKADITGRHRLGDLVWMMVWAILVDGDHGWALVEVDVPSDGRVLRIQAIESDRIGNPNESVNTSDPNYISGLSIGEYGAVESYRIFKRDRLNRYELDREVEPENFIHVFDPQRVDQYRGVSALSTVIAPARDLYEIYLFEKQAAKWQVGHAGFIEVTDPYKPTGNSAWDNVPSVSGTGHGGSKGPATMEMEAAKILRLSQGEKVNFAPGTNRPGGAFMNLVEVMVREISQGFVMPYGFLYDMTAFSGHTGRVEVAQATRGISRYQKIIGEQALDRVRDAVFERAFAENKLPFHPRYQAGRWGFGPTLTGDYGNDTSANLQLLNMGIITASDLIAETGQSFEEVTRRQASEVAYMQRVATETGIPIELFSQRMPGATDALAAMNTPPPPPPPGMVGAGVDSKPLIDVLTEVGEGTIDRESGIATVMQLYGIGRAAADKMVPQPAPKEEMKGLGRLGDIARKIKVKTKPADE